MRLATFDEVEKLSVGDRVVSGFFRDEEGVVRTVTRKDRSKDHSSGWMISVDGGEPCHCCNRPFGKPISGVDGFHFVPVA